MKNLIALFLFSILFLSCSSSIEVSQINFVSRENWSANKPKPFGTHIPNKITLHHEGTIFNPQKESAGVHIKKVQTWGMSEARNWADIPYHFIIDFDGNVFEGRNPFTVGETATNYNPEGHLLISCLGNFMEQEVPEKQLNALVNLIAYCCKKYQIDPETLKGHKDYIQTDCPGTNLYQYLQNGYLKTEAKKILSKL